MIVVADASPLIYLATLGRLDLLRLLFDDVAIPQTVYDEVVVDGAGQPGAAEVLTSQWILIHPDPPAAASLGLHEGAAQAISLALQLAADLVLLDDHKGRRAATRAGLQAVGVAGVLLLAHRRGLIPRLRPELDRLRNEANFWLSERLYLDVLHQAGELP